MATLVLGDRTLDAGLNALHNEVDRMFICSTEPSTYTDASSTYKLGALSPTRGTLFGAPSAGTPSGRVVTSSVITTGSVTTSGTAVCWASCDSTTTRLLAEGAFTGSGGVTTTQTWSLDAIPVHMKSGVASAYVGAGDIASLPTAAVWGGVRAYSTAQIGQTALQLRRDSDSQTYDCVIAADGWIDVTAITSWKGAANLFVTQLYDQISNAPYWVQATTANQPPFSLNIGNGRPSIVGASGAFLRKATAFLGAAYPHWSTSVVGGISSNLTGGQQIFWRDTDAGVHAGMWNTKPDFVPDVGQYITTHPAPTGQEFYAIQARAGGSVASGGDNSYYFRVNGTQDTGSEDTPRNIGATDHACDLLGLGVGWSLDGSLQEVGFWTTTTESFFVSVEANQRSAYSLTF